MADEPERIPSLDDPRVRFAAERTLLAWMRTGLALMGFGFVVARFGLFLREIAAARAEAARATTPGWSLGIGTALIALGVAVNLLAAVEHYRLLRRLSPRAPYPRTWLLAVAVTMLLAALGVVLAVHLVLQG